jgi:uncharacterized protein (DUF885 family)
MLDRRSFLLSTAALGATAASSNAAFAAAPVSASDPAEAAKLNALMDKVFNEQLDESPQDVTSLGIDTGVRAPARSKLDNRSAEAIRHRIALRKKWMGEFKGLKRSKLAGMDAVNYDTVTYQSQMNLEGADRFGYGAPGYPSPYVLSQLSGSYQGVPDFLDSEHPIETKQDAEAYLSRLAQFATVMDQETARAKADAGHGVVPPDFVIDKALIQMRKLRGTATEKTTLVGSITRRTADKKVGGDWAARAAKLVDGPVWAALDRQIALLESWRPKAVHTAGVARLPDGAEYYKWAARYFTTTNMSPEEIHKLGLELCKSIGAEADAIFKANGKTQGTVGERLKALFQDPKQIYPNTEQGKADLLKYLNGLVKDVTAKLPSYFGTLPKMGLDIRRVPVAVEAGAPGGYYKPGSLDGTRPGAYYINLRDTAEVPRFTLPTLTYHEGIPGHHLQGTLSLEANGIPMLRKVIWFSSYGEGWALYAEQLADEMGMYANDPWGKLGMLHDAIFRAVRLVVDSGMHAKSWTREQAIKFYMDTIGDTEAGTITEIERYCVSPGQACSYMVGKMTWLRLRAAAKQKLGAKFDIRAFHDAGLLSGAMPLEVLEHRINEWVASRA